MKRSLRSATALALAAMTAVFSVVVPASLGRACTTAVVNGSATTDGRPLLWKNRDTSARDNEVVLITGGKYRVLAVTNAGSKASIWMGMNDAGLCIENSVSKDLSVPGAKGLGNGSFMLAALKTCANVAEFEQMLTRTDQSGRATVANIGVIDATGAAALYEVGPKSHRRFPTTDPDNAPDGYVVRSNFSMTATKLDNLSARTTENSLYSGERYKRGCKLIDAGLIAGLDAQFLLRHAARDLADSQGRPLPGSVNRPDGELPPAVDTKNTIARKTTVSAAVFHGVKPGESPALTTMWVFLGDPTFSIAVPCWLTSRGVAPELDGPKVSKLCEQAKALRDECYDGDVLQTERLQAIYEHTWQIEDEIFQETQAQLEAWRQSPPSEAAVFAFHRKMCQRAMNALSELAETAPVAAGR